jgi:O-antigen ligase
VRERFAPISLRRAIADARYGHSEESFGWRLLNWHGLLIRGLERPLLGHGANATTRLNPLVNENNGIPFNAHNDFVRFFFEAGVVGVVAYAAYAAGLCWLAVRCARRARPEVAPVAYGLAGSLLALVFLTLGSPELSLNTAILFELYGAFALVIAAERTQDRAAPIPAPATPHV